MSYSVTTTNSYSYSTVDVEVVMQSIVADLVMIASSTRAISEEKARQYGHDIELLAKHGYLKAVDVTLLDGGVEVKAVRYDVNTDAGGLKTNRPGGVLWSKVNRPYLQVVLMHTPTYNELARAAMKKKLVISWAPSSADISHSALSSNAGRNYASNAFGMQRRDFS